MELLSRFFKPSFAKVIRHEKTYLYAGDLGRHTAQGPIPFVGLSLNRADYRHIRHDMRDPLAGDSVDIFPAEDVPAEDVFEHIEFERILSIVNGIFRILKPDGLIRLSLHDYRCDLLSARSLKVDGRIVFDPGGGGTRQDGALSIVVDAYKQWAASRARWLVRKVIRPAVSSGSR